VRLYPLLGPMQQLAIELFLQAREQVFARLNPV
jgi:hypothetical protein